MNYKTNPYGATLDVALAKSLPLLPGNTFNFNVGAERFHRPHHWTFQNGTAILSQPFDPKGLKPGIGGQHLPPWAQVPSVPADCSVYPKGGPKCPQWIQFDKQLLTFDAYYQEPIPETPMENYRIHQCKIYYYLEDDSIQVMEPKTYNSGIEQGQIIRRHKIPLDPPCKDRFHTMESLNIGCEVTFYGKTFIICACDKFTRNFLNRLGIPVAADMELPVDPATQKLKDAQRSQFARKPHHCVDTRGPFLKHDRHVLRFWGYWDDRCSQHGDLREFVIHYFLSDQTMEVREVIRPNSGYDSFPMFVKKSKIPKDPSKIVPLPGVETPLTLLNVFGSMHERKGKKAYVMVDNLGLGGRDVTYYNDRDLAIGAVINVFGRAIILARCDEFTKQYYKEKYGIEDFTPLDLNEPEPEPPKPVVPPYTGWGTEEDSLVSWKSIELRPHVKDYRKFAALEKDILRFRARFHKPLQTVNGERRFTINYYMADDTTQVFETEHPSSGLPKGNFFIRSQIKKPGYQPEIGKPAEYYEPKDFFVGNVLDINSFKFQLESADEFTLAYMEKHKELFPAADVCICLNKMRDVVGPHQAEDILKCFSEHDACLQGIIDFDTFRGLLLHLSKCNLSEHEIITLSRAYSAQAPLPGTDFLTLQSIIQTEMRRSIFDQELLAQVEYTCRYHDPCRTGKIDRETLRATLKGAKLPVVREIIDYLVDKFPPGDDCNRVDYCNLMRFLDWEDHPVAVATPAAIKNMLKQIEPKPPLKIVCVNYRALLEDVCPNIKCALPSVCCCCNEGRPCPEHPQTCQAQPTDYCPREQTNEPELEECPPQEPITVHVTPCMVSLTEGRNHKCAPGALNCNLNQEDKQYEASNGQARATPCCSS